MNDYYTNLNKLIEEIENNLTEKIDYKKLAKIIGTSDYTLQRIFCFLTGITLTDYIRKRRLSSAAEDLQKGEEKVIDIAVKYQYDSPISFSRAFQKMHNNSPVKVKEGKGLVKSFPKFEFTPVEGNTDEIEYRIVNLDEQIFYGKHTGKININDKNIIKSFWNDCRQDGTLNFIISNSREKQLYYGASKYMFEDENEGNKDVIDYYIMGKEPKDGFSKFIVPKSTWAIFKLESKDQKDILSLIDKIYTKWLPSSKFNVILPYPDLEIYYKDDCEYAIAVQ